jgi:membrane protein implicated in regulation of membrane protease activity
MQVWGIDVWILWATLAIIFFILEIFIPSFWIAIMGIGALAATIPAAFDLNANWQLGVFSIVSIICGIFIRPFIIKYLYKSKDAPPSNASALIGKKVRVIERINGIVEPGKVKIGSEVWKALPKDDKTVVEVDDFVEIIEVNGAKVIINKIDQ